MPPHRMSSLLHPKGFLLESSGYLIGQNRVQVRQVRRLPKRSMLEQSMYALLRSAWTFLQPGKNKITFRRHLPRTLRPSLPQEIPQSRQGGRVLIHKENATMGP